MLSSAPRTAATAPTRRRSVRLAVLAVLVGLLAPLVSVAGSADAVAVKPRTSTENAIQNQVLNLINAQRKAHHLPALRMEVHLMVTARRHNAFMTATNSMSHQVRGEASLARRVSAVGYNWSAVGENIAWNSQMSANGVLALQKLMYSEKAPNDGHRRNILNPGYREVGVDVYMDARHHKVWLTTDFGRKR